jgi:hypothetical protein
MKSDNFKALQKRALSDNFVTNNALHAQICPCKFLNFWDLTIPLQINVLNLLIAYVIFKRAKKNYSYIEVRWAMGHIDGSKIQFSTTILYIV